MDVHGYNKPSIIYHWVAAILLVALYLTGEAERGSAIFTFHIGFGAIAGIFLIWRAVRRMMRGMPDKSDQAEMLNRLSKLVIWGFLFVMIATTITGYLIFWFLGRPVDIFGLIAIPSPLAFNHDLHEGAEEIHEMLAHVFVFLLLLHVAGTLKHVFIDRDGVATRMIKAVRHGK